MLGSALTGRGVIRAGKCTIKTSESLLILPHPLTNFANKNIVKMKLHFVEFIQEIIYLK